MEPESVSHVFILLSFCPEFSTSHFPFGDVRHAHPFIFFTGRFYWPFSLSLYPTFRLVHSGPGKSSPLLDCDLSFGLRSGTKQGVETHVFRVDSAKELSTWTHLMVEGCHNAAELIKEVTTGADRDLFDCQTFLFVLQFSPASRKFKFETAREHDKFATNKVSSLSVVHSCVTEQRFTQPRLKVRLSQGSSVVKMNVLVVFWLSCSVRAC